MQILAIRKNSCFLYFWRAQIGHSVAVLINYDSSKVLCLSMSKLMTFDRIAFPLETKQVLKTNRKLNDNYQETTDSMIQIWKIKQLVQICLPIICRIVICNNNMECHSSSRLSKLFHFFYFLSNFVSCLNSYLKACASWSKIWHQGVNFMSKSERFLNEVREWVLVFKTPPLWRPKTLNKGSFRLALFPFSAWNFLSTLASNWRQDELQALNSEITPIDRTSWSRFLIITYLSEKLIRCLFKHRCAFVVFINFPSLRVKFWSNEWSFRSNLY